jgi:hypothetical protein
VPDPWANAPLQPNTRRVITAKLVSFKVSSWKFFRSQL